MSVSTIIARNLSLKERDVHATIQLLNEGATIPFISRYRKERTGGLDEVEIGKIQEAHRSHLELEKRREYVLSSMEELGVLTSELKEQVLACYTLTALEDVYLPYKPKRKTRAEAARKLGLEPLAGHIDETRASRCRAVGAAICEG